MKRKTLIGIISGSAMAALPIYVIVYIVISNLVVEYLPVVVGLLTEFVFWVVSFFKS